MIGVEGGSQKARTLRAKLGAVEGKSEDADVFVAFAGDGHARRDGMRSVLVVEGESLIPEGWDRYLCTSAWAYDRCCYENRTHLPWPIDTDPGKFRRRTGRPKIFWHDAGEGTPETIEAWIKAGVDADLVVCSERAITQFAAELQRVFAQGGKYRIDFRRAAPTDGLARMGAHVLLVTSQGLPDEAHEAWAHGIPTILLGVPPLDEALRHFEERTSKRCRWIAEPHRSARNPYGAKSASHPARPVPDVADLIEAIRWSASDDLYCASEFFRGLAQNRSWDYLAGLWSDAIVSG